VSNKLAKEVVAAMQQTHWEWLGIVGGCLHYVPAMRKRGAYERFRDNFPQQPQRTACGLLVQMFLPGVANRLSGKRCDWCCDRLGIPRGYGTPGNEMARKAREAP